MATKSVEINNLAYTQLDTTPGSAIDCQNVGSAPIRVVLAAALPAVDDQAFYSVPGGAGVSRDGKTGNFYAISSKTSSFVTVGE